MKTGPDYEKVYSAEESAGLRGKDTREPYRYVCTLRHVPRGAGSLLDVGCGEGHWLGWVRERRAGLRLCGFEVAPNRVEHARRLYPGLDVRQGNIFTEDPGQFDVVTCLEVLEHLEDWKGAVERLLKFTKKKLILSVPYKEELQWHVCVHCGEMTPRYGHLHSLSEESFAYLKDRFPVETHRLFGEHPSLVHHVYHRLRPKPYWMLVVVHVDGARVGAPSLWERAGAEVTDRALGFLPRRLLL